VRNASRRTVIAVVAVVAVVVLVGGAVLGHHLLAGTETGGASSASLASPSRSDAHQGLATTPTTDAVSAGGSIGANGSTVVVLVGLLWLAGLRIVRRRRQAINPA
jgi:hypothetical protein